MIGSIARGVAAVVLGFLAAAFFIVATEGVSAYLYPPAEGCDLTNMEDCRAHITGLPASAFLIGVAGWALAVFASSWVATRLGVARHPAFGIALGLLLLAAAIMNMSMLPYPIWFWVGNLIAFPLCTVLGVLLARGPSGPRARSGLSECG